MAMMADAGTSATRNSRTRTPMPISACGARASAVGHWRVVRRRRSSSSSSSSSSSHRASTPSHPFATEPLPGPRRIRDPLPMSPSFRLPLLPFPLMVSPSPRYDERDDRAAANRRSASSAMVLLFYHLPPGQREEAKLGLMIPPSSCSSRPCDDPNTRDRGGSSASSTHPSPPLPPSWIDVCGGGESSSSN
jgi:hypothetical protein